MFASFIIDYNRAKADAPAVAVNTTGRLLYALHAGTGYARAPMGSPTRLVVEAITWAALTGQWPRSAIETLASMTGREIAPLFDPRLVAIIASTPADAAPFVFTWLEPHIAARESVASDQRRGIGISERAPVGLPGAV